MSGIVLSREEKDLKRVIDAVMQLLEGRSNAVGRVTLRAGFTTTVVAAPNVGITTEVVFAPRTPHAEALSPQPYVALGGMRLGSFTITHANSAFTDLTFGYMGFG